MSGGHSQWVSRTAVNKNRHDSPMSAAISLPALVINQCPAVAGEVFDSRDAVNIFFTSHLRVAVPTTRACKCNRETHSQLDGLTPATMTMLSMGSEIGSAVSTGGRGPARRPDDRDRSAARAAARLAFFAIRITRFFTLTFQQCL